MGTGQTHGTVIWIRTDHARTLGHEHDHGHFHPVQGLVLHHDGFKDIDVETVHRRHGEEGGGGVPATQAFLVIATEVGAGVVVDMDVGGDDRTARVQKTALKDVSCMNRWVTTSMGARIIA